MVSYCFVLDVCGRKLSPTNENKGWYLIRKNKAKWIRVNSIHLENVQIDIRKLEKGSQLYCWEYQQSNRLDENLRQATLMRDDFTCQDCGKRDGRLEAHHIVPRRLSGSGSIHNLITLCPSCHGQVTGEEMTHADRFFSRIGGKKTYFQDAMHVMQGKTYLQHELKKIAPVTLTSGGDTANRRIDWCIEKSHSNDAIVLSQLKVSPEQCHIKDWLIKPMRRRSKKKVEDVQGFQHRDFVRYTKRNGETYEGYITALYPKKKQCNLTTTEGKVLKRYGVSRIQLLWRFRNMYFFENKKIK